MPDADDSNVYRYRPDSNLGSVVGLVRDVVTPGGTIIDLGAGSGVIAEPLVAAGYGYFGVDEHPRAVERMGAAGLACARCDVEDMTAVAAAVADVADPACVLLLDVIEHLERPDLLLSRLSKWARSRGGVPLVVSVPNVTHRDVAVRLLCGRFTMTPTGLLDSTHLRFFDEPTLERLITNAGWRTVARDDYHVERSDQYDALAEQLPASVTSLLRLITSVCSSTATIQQYIWLLEPARMATASATYLDAIAGSDRVKVIGEEAVAAVSSHVWAVSGVTYAEHARVHREYEESVAAFRALEDAYRALEDAYRALEAHYVKTESEY